jgi:HJR/Mrr/RecB family endonuclease
VLEFSRNRKHVVIDRISSLKTTRQNLKAATDDAIEVIESAIEQLLILRERHGTNRAWDPSASGLGLDELHRRLDGIMDPALAELDKLTTEHDLDPGGIQRSDPILPRIDELLTGKIGSPYTSTQLRAIVDEATTFRFPNKIPPGFLDSDKETPLLRAGDYILWRQTIDRATLIDGENRLVLFVTNDLKHDWWEIDARKTRLGPRPELVQEFRETTGADLLLLSLNEFLAGSKEHLESIVSDETLQEVQEVDESSSIALLEVLRSNSREFDLLNLSPWELEQLVRHLFVQLGYGVEMSQDSTRGEFDFLLLDRSTVPVQTTIVEVKRYRSSLGIAGVRQLQGTLLATAADKALLITTGSYTANALEAAKGTPVELIDGSALIKLFARIGVRVTIGLKS